MKLAEPRALAVSVTVCALLAIGGRVADAGALVWIFKPLATILIVAAAWSRGSDRYARAVLVGLLFSLAGDVLLIPQGMFVFGLVAFLLAHVAYLFAFTREVPLFARALPFALVALVAAAVLAVLWTTLPAGLRLPVLAYVVLLGAMTAQSQARAAVLNRPDARLAAWGGALFMCSDALLAIDRFHTPLPLAPLLVLGTYYPAQVLIALSIAPAPHARRL